jgi:trimeric autotransporter adhesin
MGNGYAKYGGLGGGGGGGGTPGGAANSVQFNNGGSFGGFGSWNGTTLGVTGNLNFTGSGALGSLAVTGNSVLATLSVTGNAGFFGAAEIAQPTGNILTALSNLGLVSSPTVPASSITGTGNLTDAGTDGIIVTGGSGALLSSASLAQHVADTTHNGYLASTDWNTFNGKQAAGSYITALTGDVTASGPGSAAATLASVATAGTTGSSTAIPVVTINAKGLTTTITTAAVIAPAGTLSGTVLNSTVVTSSLTSLGTQSQALNMGSFNINAVLDPTTAQQAATKNYVDTVASGLNPLQAVTAATIGSNIPGTYVQVGGGIGDTFTTTSTSTFTLDGTTPAVGSRVLFKDQTSGQQNGIYNLTTQATGIVGAIFTRSLDYDTVSDVNAGDLIPVINGTINAQTSWLQTANVTSIGTSGTPMVFTQWTANPANYLLKANNLSDVANKATSYNNISPMTTTGDMEYESGTGVAARLPIGTTGQVMTVAGGIPSWATGTTLGFWSGYHKNGNQWSVTSTAFTPFTSIGTTPAITTRLSSGITVTQSGTTPSITFTPASSSSIYFITCAFAATCTVSTVQQVAFSLSDGSTEILESYGDIITNGNTPFTLAGIYSPGTASPVTVQLSGASAAGTLEIQELFSGLLLDSVIEWTLTQIPQNIISPVSSSLIGAMVTYGIFS